MSLGGIGKNYRQKLSLVLSKGLAILTATTVSKTLNISEPEARRILSRWNKSGWVNRIKQGVYVPQPINTVQENLASENPFIIAEMLFAPGYLGGYSAIKHWDLSEQIFEVVNYFTTKKIKRKAQVIGNIKIKLKNISKYRMFGVKTVWFDNKKIMVSDPTKTIIDFLDDPSMAGGMTIIFDFYEEYLNSKFYDFPLLIEYGKKMNNRTIFKRLGYMLETKGILNEQNETQLLHLLSKGLSVFDPTMDCGNVNKKWNLKIPMSWKKEYDRKK
ncbi:MAG TPA: hypothetical protein VNJ01_15760 [Bacteriovoracaceae bacterium]|nr:hypothetical protein [Bacteriovoracaceae bacterium]